MSVISRNDWGKKWEKVDPIVKSFLFHWRCKNKQTTHLAVPGHNESNRIPWPTLQSFTSTQSSHEEPSCVGPRCSSAGFFSFESFSPICVESSPPYKFQIPLLRPPVFVLWSAMKSGLVSCCPEEKGVAAFESRSKRLPSHDTADSVKRFAFSLR